MISRQHEVGRFSMEEALSRNVVMTDQQHQLETALTYVSSGIVHYIFYLP